eukprot:g28275.t1
MPLKISSIKHHAFLSLEEQGVQEAPVLSPNDRQLIMDFHVTQPFLVVLYDNPTGSLLHIGRVLDPRGLYQLSNNLLSDAQFGCCQGHSAPDLITALVRTWTKELYSRGE